VYLKETSCWGGTLISLLLQPLPLRAASLVILYMMTIQLLFPCICVTEVLLFLLLVFAKLLVVGVLVVMLGGGAANWQGAQSCVYRNTLRPIISLAQVMKVVWVSVF
jgi:hypothetical protein